METLGFVKERVPEIDGDFVRRYSRHRRPVHSQL